MAAEGDPGLFESIYSMRALRRFRPDPIPDEVLFQLFDAAIRAPSGQNAQDWRFIVITDPAVKAKMQGWAEAGVAPLPAGVLGPPGEDRRPPAHAATHAAERPAPGRAP